MSIPVPCRLLVLVGPHGAGKTTCGRAVASALGWPFHEEIGLRLRREALAADRDAHAMRDQAGFDRRIFVLEAARDEEARDLPGRVAETWHPGNLAYAEQRSRRVSHAWKDALRDLASAAGPSVVVQPLILGRPASIARLTEPGPPADELAAFFRRVGRRAVAIAREWGLGVLPPIRTDLVSPEQTAARVLRALGAASGGAAHEASSGACEQPGRHVARSTRRRPL